MSVKFGYDCVHESHSPTELLKYAVLAERNGFDFLLSSDHFHPWMHTDAWSGFAWVWIAAAAERTKQVPIGTCVTPPILRYHPALVAQAFATLGFMYPERIFLTVATGEAMNEIPLGFPWPPFKERTERLIEAVKIIKLLWKEEFVTFRGKYFTLEKANLYTKPKKPIPLYIAASGTTVAKIAGQYGDGLLASAELNSLKEKILPAFFEGAMKAGKDPSKLTKIVSARIVHAEDYDEALNTLRLWSGSQIPGIILSDVYDPRELERRGKELSDEELVKGRLVAPNPEECKIYIEERIKLGFDKVYVAGLKPDNGKFILWFSEKVLPYLKETYCSTR